jgi:protein-tyrosine phosphatase
MNRVSYVDLHCHLLPDLDDGAASIEETVQHARRLEAEGVRDVACTPHIKREYFPHVVAGELAAHRDASQAAIADAGLRVRLHPGGELAHPDALALDPADLAHIAQGPSDARWLLLECPFRGVGDDFLAAAERLEGLGYGLLLAHPERSDRLQDEGLARLRPLLERGALLQVNVCSLLGNHGLVAQEAATRLVRGGWAYCLASDGHPGTREHTLQLGFHLLLRAGASSTQAYRLTQSNPRFLLTHGTRRLVEPIPERLAA